MEESVRLWIDRSVQPILLSIDSDHRLIQGDLIRACIPGWL